MPHYKGLNETKQKGVPLGPSVSSWCSYRANCLISKVDPSPRRFGTIFSDQAYTLQNLYIVLVL